MISTTLPEKKSVVKIEDNLQNRKNSQLSDNDANRKNSQLSDKDQKQNKITNNNKENSNLQNNESKIERKTSISNDNFQVGQDEECSNQAINNESQNKSEKEDNNSDVSSLVNQKIENQEIKMVKKTKLKKTEFDRKSHLSHNIEGVIFEDVNEDEEWEEKDKHKNQKNNHHQNDHTHKNVVDKSKLKYCEKINNTENSDTIKDVLKRNNSSDVNSEKKIETTKTSIMQELLKVRNLNFSTANKDENNTDNTIPLKHSVSNPVFPKNSMTCDLNEINTKSKNDIQEDFISFDYINTNNSNFKAPEFKNEKLNNNSNKKEIRIEEDNENNISENFINDLTNMNLNSDQQSNINYIVNRIKKEKQKEQLLKEVKEKILKQSSDEEDFYEIAKTIKIHKTTEKMEILKQIFQSNMEKYIKKGDIIESLISLNGIKKNFDNSTNNNQEKTSGLREENNRVNKKEDIFTNIYKDCENELKNVVENMQNFKLNSKNEKIKSFIACKNTAFNVLTKKKYSHEKKVRLRIVNGMAFVFILIVFSVYHFYIKNL